MEIFADEILTIKNKSDNSKWAYIGALFVPLEKKEDLMLGLNNLRCINHKNWHQNEDDCPCKCNFHTRNNTEIHYSELDRTSARSKIAENWLNFLIDKALRKNFLNFNILGLNLSNMNLDLFGGLKGRDLNIYNRFFRSMIKGSLNYFYGKYDEITINNIYHDKGSQQNHKYFPWHIMYKLSSEMERIKFLSDKIIFINSDHRNSHQEESQLIQLIDLILGATVINLHDQSKKKAQRTIGLLFQPILKIILDRKKGNNAYYGHYYHDKRVTRKCGISFFPEKKLLLNESGDQIDLFGKLISDEVIQKFYYYQRDLLLKKNLQTLDKWLKKDSPI